MNASRLHWLDVDKLLEAPPPPVPWIVEPLLARGALTLLAGAHGSGKSLFAMALAAAVAVGAKDIAGMPVDGGGVVIIDAENGEHTLHERAHLGRLPAGRVRAALAHGFDLRAQGAVEELGEAIADQPVSLMILDSLASLAPGLKENDADQVGPVLDRLRHLAHGAQTALLLLHHTRKDGDSYRGGTGIPAAVDVAAVYGRRQRSTDRQCRFIDWSHERGGKMRLGPEPAARHLRLTVIRGQLIVEALDAPAADEATPGPMRKRDLLRHEAIAHVAEHGPTRQGELLRALGLDSKDHTGRRALHDAQRAEELLRQEESGHYILGPRGGTVATPGTATGHANASGGGRQHPSRGAATCHLDVGAQLDTPRAKSRQNGSHGS